MGAEVQDSKKSVEVQDLKKSSELKKHEEATKKAKQVYPTPVLNVEAAAQATKAEVKPLSVEDKEAADDAHALSVRTAAIKEQLKESGGDSELDKKAADLAKEQHEKLKKIEEEVKAKEAKESLEATKKQEAADSKASLAGASSAKPAQAGPHTHSK